MKKIVIVSIMMIFSFSVFAQVAIGLKGAFGISKISADLDDLKAGVNAGYQLGGYVRLGEKLHLQPELYFTAKTGNLDYNFTETDLNNPTNSYTKSIEQNIKLSTIDIPVLVGYRILKLPSLKVRIHAGPVASVIISKKFDVTVDGIKVEEEESPVQPDDFKNINWGLQFGGGIDFMFLTADLRYEIGLNNMFETPESWAQQTTMKNYLLFISVGFKIFSF
jgi:hypothetical protein